MNQETLEKKLERLSSLLEVGKAMTSVRDLDSLLNLILQEVTRVMDADRSSLYILDRDKGELWTKIAQELEVKEIRIKVGQGIAGYVAATGKIVNIKDAYDDSRFNREVDRRTGYRTRTILTVPMINRQGEVTGVLQVLNKREGEFTEEDEELLHAFGGQAAVAIENAILYEEVQTLFEGFIRASVYAIESRDPTTRGHSERVALLTIGLAEKVDRVDEGPYAGVEFTLEDIKELRYASLLHDFGKVGVREHVLVKANKLYEPELELLRSRFKLIRKALEAEYLERKLDCLLRLNRKQALSQVTRLDEELKKNLDELDNQLAFILQANLPTILPSGGLERLAEISSRYLNVDGTQLYYLTEKEAHNLEIPRGSLNDEERLEIESHVTYTFRFLEKIPWSRDLKRVPAIAYAHHEKVDGSGYPNHLRRDEIPVQSKLMTISDIYDALTAADRPYKKAVPTDRALDILTMEMKDDHLDEELLRIFIEAKVYELAAEYKGFAL